MVLVQPTTPVGPRDRGPTPTGRTVLEFLNGRFPGYVDTTLNIVDVDDVARGHILAAERGGNGRSYILGGENLLLRDVLGTLARVAGLPAPTRQFPNGLALGAAHVAELVGRLLHREPLIPLEAARMSTTHMSFDDTRARTELGYPVPPPGRGIGPCRPVVCRRRLCPPGAAGAALVGRTPATTAPPASCRAERVLTPRPNR